MAILLKLLLHILMYYNTFPATFTAVRCFQLRKMVLRLDATSYQSSNRTVQHLCFMTTKWVRVAVLWRIRTSPRGDEQQWCPCLAELHHSENKIIAKYCPWINLQLWNFCHSFLQWMGSFFLIIMQYMFIQIGWQTWASLSFVPPGWGANSSQSCHSCSFSGHKQGAGPTVLSELRYKVVYNPNTFFWIGSNVQQKKPLRMHCNTWKYMKQQQNCQGIYWKMSRNKSFDVRARFGAVYSAFKTKKYLLKNSTIGNRLLLSEFI